MSVPNHKRLAVEGGTPVLPPNVHRRWPEITAADRLAVSAALDGDIWGIHGVQVTALQEEYAGTIGARYCLAVNSGTAALHCALVASGIESGQEVIVPAFTFVASAMAVLQVGATPVFCDIDPRTYTLDAAKLDSLISARTTAIMPVHIQGLPADMDAINAIADAHGLAVIEDAAQAHGATYQGRRAGTLGGCAAFSLNGAKPLNAGEGGIFATSNPDAMEAAQRLAVLGEQTPKPHGSEVRAFWSRGLGWNYRIHELTAALARSQLRRLADYNARARANAAILTAGLADMPGITPPHIPQGVESAYCRYRFRIDPTALGWTGDPTECRDRLLFALRAEGLAVDTWQLWPVPAQPVFRSAIQTPWTRGRAEPKLERWDPARFPEASRLLNESLCFGPDREPLYVQEEAVIRRYVDALDKVLGRLDVVFTTEYEPVRVVPTIPRAELSLDALTPWMSV
jgi:perosamine synthetase